MDLRLLKGFWPAALLPRTKRLSNNELIATFRTITTLLNLLQSIPADHAHVNKDTDSSRAHSDPEHRNLTALAVLLVREFDVTAVLAGSPQPDGTLDLLAAREQQYFALRNPRGLDPSVTKADPDGNFPDSGVSFKISTPDVDVNFDIKKPLKGILRTR